MSTARTIACALILLCCLSACKDDQSRQPKNESQPPRIKSAVHDSIQVWGANGDRVVIIYAAPGECSKCDLVMTRAVDWIGGHAPTTKIVAAVQCRRRVELAAYQKNNDQIDHVVMNTPGLWKELGGDRDSRALVFDKDGRLCGNIRLAQYFGNIDSALAAILTPTIRAEIPLSTCTAGTEDPE